MEPNVQQIITDLMMARLQARKRMIEQQTKHDWYKVDFRKLRRRGYKGRKRAGVYQR